MTGEWGKANKAIIRNYTESFLGAFLTLLKATLEMNQELWPWKYKGPQKSSKGHTYYHGNENPIT